MRIGIVSAHYMPEVGYQEVLLAKACSRIGHTVKVFTSATTVGLGGSINQIRYETGLTTDSSYGYEILRLPAVSFKSKVIGFGLKKAVLAFNPDVLIILGVAKLFPLPLFDKKLNDKIKLISVYGDAKEYLERNTVSQKVKTFAHELGYATIKRYTYKKAVKYCHKIILNIPETEQVFHQLLSSKEKNIFDKKKIFLNLGFDPDEYFFSRKERNEIREKYGINNDEVVIITSTRINKRKNIEKIIALISQLNSQGKKIKYILVGFLGDSYEKELKEFIASQPKPEAFICFPFLKAGEIRKLYSAADAGIWLKVAISIQEAMGTGLPVILENKPSVNHLLQTETSGWFFENNTFNETISKAVDALSENATNREELAKINSVKLSYDNIAKNILHA